ncbi:DEAD/DEAH box helicase family protein [Nautilia lithotrophica]
MNSELLSQQYDILSEFGYLKREIPECVVDNLNPKFNLRYYQKEALARFIHYLNENPNKIKPIQLLFNMATGAGKTLLMAANILYLYERGYRNFIFFVNSTNIIEKTKDNFLNPLSPKYLFNEKIKFQNKEVKIKEVSNFYEANAEEINIIFTTIQGLHSQLNIIRENSITLEDFKEFKVVLISDEAHHINSFTKNKLTKKEEELQNSWEHTVNKILHLNKENILLEYTATIDLENIAIYEKYKNKLIYKYDLKNFRADGYSKEVKVLQADLNKNQRMLQAVILSQYRRKIAEKYKIRLKPVILFKSKSIKDSKENYELFRHTIEMLSKKDILDIKAHSSDTIYQTIFDYLEKNDISIDNFIYEIKEDFSENKCVLMDSENIDKDKQIKLNTLEDPNNEIRAIFTVKMLDEGWDVLNLFDIVRLYDTRDGKWTKDGKYIPGNTTISERQLIGRGARYYPFKFNDEDPYKRKFDNQLNHELRIIEELYYHSTHNPRYIKELTNALIDYGIMPSNEKEILIKVKEDIKKSDFYKKGVVFVNRRIKTDKKKIKNLKDININKIFKLKLQTGINTEIAILKEISSNTYIENSTLKTDMSYFGIAVIRKAMAKLDFYTFDNLKKYFPALKSSLEFIDSLKDIKIEINGSKEKLNNLTPDEKLDICIKVLKELEKEIISNNTDYIGSKEFIPVKIKNILKDKKIKVSSDERGERETGISMSESKHQELVLNLKDKEWYLFEENYGTFEEKAFIKFIDDVYDKLKNRYEKVYLLRNEKMFKIYNFNDGKAFEPDFVLFLKGKNKNKTLQVFIEPKGKHLINTDKWKEDLLLRIEKEYKIKPNVDLFEESDDYILIGMPFFNEDLRIKFEKKFKELC